jgi:hypothetical protein
VKRTKDLERGEFIVTIYERDGAWSRTFTTREWAEEHVRNNAHGNRYVILDRSKPLFVVMDTPGQDEAWDMAMGRKA